MADVVAMYLLEKKSTSQIAEAMSVPRSRVRKMLLDAGVELRSPADGIRLRADDLGSGTRGKTRVISEEWRQNIRKSRLAWGEKNSVGVSRKTSGYVQFTRGPNKHRSEHVVVMEARLGRPLTKDECVHHIDGDRGNNSIDNLALVTRSGHTRLHRREQRLMKGLLK